MLKDNRVLLSNVMGYSYLHSADVRFWTFPMSQLASAWLNDVWDSTNHYISTGMMTHLKWDYAAFCWTETTSDNYGIEVNPKRWCTSSSSSNGAIKSHWIVKVSHHNSVANSTRPSKDVAAKILSVLNWPSMHCRKEFTKSKNILTSIESII